jgi:hypothetical protein
MENGVVCGRERRESMVVRVYLGMVVLLCRKRRPNEWLFCFLLTSVEP